MNRKLPKSKLQYSFHLDNYFYYMYNNGFAYRVNKETEKAKRITAQHFLNKRAEAKNY